MTPHLVDALVSYIPQVLPEGILAVFACILFLGGAWTPGRTLWGVVALVGLALAGAGLWYTGTQVPTLEAQRQEITRLEGQLEAETSAEKREAIEEQIGQREQALSAAAYSAPLQHSGLTQLIRIVALAGALILLLFSWDQVPVGQTADHHACLLLITAGVGLTGAANELITLFLALELISIPTYVMLYLPRADAPAQEAALKYFLLSVFSSALLLFGFSYLYGVAGTTNLTAIAEAVGVAGSAGSSLRGLPLIALVMVVAGLGFRITAVPFHFYAPDVYQGTATPVAALLAFVPKLAGFVALARLLGLIPQPPLPMLADQAPILLWIVAAVTMTLGNVLALLQNNVKRLLAYSSVAHAGYMLIGLAVAPRLLTDPGVPIGGVEAVLFYLVAYGAMTIGAFAVLSWLDTPGQPVETVDDLSGLGRTHPGSALVLALFLFSLIGLPLTAGFVGKLLIFLGALRVPYDAADPASVEQARLFTTLVVIAAVNAAIGGWYYLRIAAVMYLRSSLRPIAARRPSPVLAAIALCALITLAAGLYPNPLVEAVKAAVRGTPAVTTPAEQARAAPAMIGD